MKDLLCPKSRSLVNYSDVLLLKCKSITNLFVLIIRWKKEKLFIKASQIFRNSCQITCTLVQLISGTRTYTQSMSEPWSKRNDKPVIVPPSSQVLTHLLSPHLLSLSIVSVWVKPDSTYRYIHLQYITLVILSIPRWIVEQHWAVMRLRPRSNESLFSCCWNMLNTYLSYHRFFLGVPTCFTFGETCQTQSCTPMKPTWTETVKPVGTYLHTSLWRKSTSSCSSIPERHSNTSLKWVRSYHKPRKLWTSICQITLRFQDPSWEEMKTWDSLLDSFQVSFNWIVGAEGQ